MVENFKTVEVINSLGILPTIKLSRGATNPFHFCFIKKAMDYLLLIQSFSSESPS
jgi:hypothetical protein